MHTEFACMTFFFNCDLQDMMLHWNMQLFVLFLKCWWIKLKDIDASTTSKRWEWLQEKSIDRPWSTADVGLFDVRVGRCKQAFFHFNYSLLSPYLYMCDVTYHTVSVYVCVKHFLWVCTFHIEMTFIEPVRYHVQAPRRLNILGHPQLGRRSTVGWVGPGRHCVWQETKDLKHLSQEPHCYFKAFLTQCRGVTGTAAVASMADAGSSEVQADGVHAHSAKID